MAEPVPAGSEDSRCSVGRRDAGGCEAPEPAQTESAMDSSQNAEREDLEVTTCLSSWCSLLGSRRARRRSDLFLPPSDAGTLAAAWYQQLLAACSVLPLFSSSRQLDAIGHAQEKSPELRGLTSKPVTGGGRMDSIYALNLANLRVLTRVSLWPLMLLLTGLSVLLTPNYTLFCSSFATSDLHGSLSRTP